MPVSAFGGVCHDTRTLKPGDLYVAIRGDRFDGHDFVGEAFAKGASGALVENGFEWNDNPVLPVPDTVKGLQDIARGYRTTWTSTVVGITGSVGKTTVKEMCADVLSMNGETHRTAGNYNNHIGLPLTMLSMPASARYGVFEIGMNQPGEIEQLTDLLRPDVGILTDICNAHRESFDSLEAIAREKIKLVERVPESGVVIIDHDSEWYAMMCERICASISTISLGGDADVVGRRLSEDKMNVNGFDYTLPQPGEHIMRNALRAVALGLEVGMKPDAIAQGLLNFRAPPMRWEKSEINGVYFINDAYNANPLSMRASLRTFDENRVPGRKWVVIGGMRELGAVAEEEHAALGRFMDGLDLDGIIAVGELTKAIECKSKTRYHRCSDPESAAMILKENLSAGDHVLLKASRGEKLEKVLERFKEF